MPDGPPLQEIRAAGAVLWQPCHDGPGGPARSAVRVALIHRPRYDDWTLPKGKAKPGEHPLLCAVREVAEETGVRAVLGRPLGAVCYEVGGRRKRVDYWAAVPASDGEGSQVRNGGAAWHQPPARPAEGRQAGPEVDRLEWVGVGEAVRRVSYTHDADVLRRFAAAPTVTAPFIFLRHASAGEKADWPDDDLLRPLDAAGRAAAGALADLLACYGPARVFSSAAARCVETVLPYAVRAGVPVTAEPALTLGAAGGEAAAHAWLGRLLADGGAVIMCVHGEYMPGLLAQVLAHLGAPPHADATLEKAAFKVLHMARAAGGAVSLAGVEEHRIG